MPWHEMQPPFLLSLGGLGLRSASRTSTPAYLACCCWGFFFSFNLVFFCLCFCFVCLFFVHTSCGQSLKRQKLAKQSRSIVVTTTTFAFVTSICQWPDWMVAVMRWSWTASATFGRAQLAVDTTFVSPAQADGRLDVQSETAWPLTRHVRRPTRIQSSQVHKGEVGWSSLLR